MTLTVTNTANDASLLVGGIEALKFNVNGVMSGIGSTLQGLTMSTAGSSATMTIAAGKCSNSDITAMMVLSSAISKTTSAWAVGTAQGGLDTGAIANSTWYHFYAIYRPDTGVSDVIFSTSASSPSLPANYTKYRRIGSALTNGSAQWTKFIQDGDLFTWDVPVNNVDLTNPGTSAVLRTMSTPLGLIVEGIFALWSSVGASGTYMLVTNPAQTNSTPSSTLFTAQHPVANTNYAMEVRKQTNTSSQIRTRNSVSDASVGMRITTVGWVDTRGRDA